MKQLTSMGLRPYFGASRKLRGFPVSPGMDDGSGVVGGFNPYFDPKYAADFAYGGAPGGPHPHFGLHSHGPPHPLQHHPNPPFGDFFGGPHPPPPPPPPSSQGVPGAPPGAGAQGTAGNAPFGGGPGKSHYTHSSSLSKSCCPSILASPPSSTGVVCLRLYSNAGHTKHRETIQVDKFHTGKKGKSV